MKGPKRKPTPGSESPAVEAPELPERWSAARKREVVLRLLQRNLAEDPQKWTRTAAAIKGVTEETTTGLLRLRTLEASGGQAAIA